jgi:transposase-like protein
MDGFKTLQEAMIHFADFENCKAVMVQLRWPDGKVACPACGSQKVTWLAKARVWKCYAKHQSPTFTLKTGTVFEDSPIGLDKWLPALWLVVNCKNGISSCESARDLGVTQKTAWFMNHRLRYALKDGGFRLLSGEVEVDETFIGGKARNMHKAKRAQKITGTGGKDKVVVMGMIERGGKVRAMVVGHRKKKAVQKQIRDHVEAGSAIFQRRTRIVQWLGVRLPARRHQSRRRVRERQRSHQRDGELLEPLEARPGWDLHQHRTVPPVPLHRRTGVPL